MKNETAYCGECRELKWIEEVLVDTPAPPSERVPRDTRLRRVKFACGHLSNVISRFVAGR